VANHVLIILVNYKGHLDTVECLESIFKLKGVDFKVAVIDNSEDEVSIEYITNWALGKVTSIDTQYSHLTFPLIEKPIAFHVGNESDIDIQFEEPITIVKSSNRGFAAANNIALKHSLRQNFDFFWLLNNDTVVEPDSLLQLLNCALEDSKVGICGSKLLLYQDPSTLQGVGGRYNKWFGKVSEIGYLQQDNHQWDSKSFSIDYVIGAAMLIQKKFLVDVGPMEEDYFLYYEELDWAIRGRRKNWDIGYCSKSKVYHKMGSSINKKQKSGSSLLADYYSVRNRILITKRFFRYAYITLYPAFSKFIINRIILGQYSRIIMLLKIIYSPKKHFKETHYSKIK
jgi:GT2 family glycosyltransferase